MILTARLLTGQVYRQGGHIQLHILNAAGDRSTAPAALEK